MGVGGCDLRAGGPGLLELRVQLQEAVLVLLAQQVPQRVSQLPEPRPVGRLGSPAVQHHPVQGARRKLRSAQKTTQCSHKNKSKTYFGIL